MNTTQKVIEIFAKLKVEMNGAVTEAMQKRGVSYGLNYGVSAITVKRAVSDYAPDHSLAQALWRQQIREMKLAAIFVDNPQEVTAPQIEQWIDESKTIELTGQCATQLFWRSPYATQVIENWVVSGQDLTKITAALLMAGRLAHNSLLNAAVATKIVDYSPGSGAPLHLAEALRYALREIYTSHTDLRDKILSIDDAELQEQIRYSIV